MEETITQRKMDDEIEQYTQTRIEGTGGVILYSIITLCTVYWPPASPNSPQTHLFILCLCSLSPLFTS